MWQTVGLGSQSHAFREALQEYIERHAYLKELSDDAVAALTSDYEQTLVISLHTVQHDSRAIIKTTHHTHGE